MAQPNETTERLTLPGAEAPLRAFLMLGLASVYLAGCANSASYSSEPPLTSKLTTRAANTKDHALNAIGEGLKSGACVFTFGEKTVGVVAGAGSAGMEVLDIGQWMAEKAASVAVRTDSRPEKKQQTRPPEKGLGDSLLALKDTTIGALADTLQGVACAPGFLSGALGLGAEGLNALKQAPGALADTLNSAGSSLRRTGTSRTTN